MESILLPLAKQSQRYIRLGLLILLHSLPLWPLVAGRPYLMIAALLFICLPYIKVKKLGLQLNSVEDLLTQSAHPHPLTRQLAEDLRISQRRWQVLTFPL